MKYYIVSYGRLGTHHISEAMTKEQAEAAISAVYNMAMDDYECVIDETQLEEEKDKLHEYEARFGRGHLK